jgi:hypothetical protein
MHSSPRLEHEEAAKTAAQHREAKNTRANERKEHLFFNVLSERNFEFFRGLLEVQKDTAVIGEAVHEPTCAVTQSRCKLHVPATMSVRTPGRFIRHDDRLNRRQALL